MVDDFLQLPADWQSALASETTKPYYRQLAAEITRQYTAATVFPPVEQVFEAFNLCPLQQVKVVILGQDPYHAAGQAHGLCFSVNAGVRIPPSLKNIYKELENDIPGFRPPVSGDLRAWAREGVLLLNSVLTVKEASAGSHRALGWERFTDAVIKTVSDYRPAVVFMLWGNYAIEKRSLINDQKHLVLTAPHPSPLARGGFSGCRHFSRANEWLASKGLSPVSWQLPG